MKLALPRLSMAQWLWAAAAAALALVLLWLIWPRALEVDSATIDRGMVRREIVDEARTRIHDVFVISAPVSGDLQRIELHPGDGVARGAVVATILPAEPPLLDARLAAEANANVAAAEASLAAAEASADLARRDQGRIARLTERGYTAQAALDGANAALRAARAAVAARQADLQRALVAAGRGGLRARTPTQVHSPAAGHVLRILQESQGLVAAGTPLIEIGDPKNLEVVAEFLTQDATLIRPGAAAFLEGWGGEQSLAARVSRVEPYAHTKVSALGVEEQRVNVILHLADSRAAPPLGHGFRLDARIVLEEYPDALRVPVDALIRDGSGWAVFRIEQGRARLTSLRVGSGGEHYRVVWQGLSAGDSVILFPGDSIRDGARVRANANIPQTRAPR
jgi:HlyD family secretion protein